MVFGNPCADKVLINCLSTFGAYRTQGHSNTGRVGSLMDSQKSRPLCTFLRTQLRATTVLKHVNEILQERKRSCRAKEVLKATRPTF